MSVAKPIAQSVARAVAKSVASPGDTVVGGVPALAIQDRAGNYIFDRAGNYIVSRV